MAVDNQFLERVVGSSVSQLFAVGYLVPHRDHVDIRGVREAGER